MVRQLRSLLQKAKEKLEQRISQLLERAKAETLVVSNKRAETSSNKYMQGRVMR
jgi:hypothetical protein